MRLHKKTEELGSLKPEEKVELVIEMSDVCMRVCIAGILMQNPGMNEKNLLRELRERIEWMKKHYRNSRGVLFENIQKPD